MAIDLSTTPRPSRARISALFMRGTEVVFGEDESGPIVGWVMALTRTQREEALLAGAMAAARARLVYVPGNADYDLLVQDLSTLPLEQVAQSVIAAAEMSEIWAVSEQDLHADPYWRESDRLTVIRTADAQINAGAEIDEAEQEALFELNLRYQEDWRKYASKRIEARTQELVSQGQEKLSQLYIEAAVTLRTLGRQAREYNVTAVRYALRACSATPKEGGGFDHSSCGNHSEWVYTDIAEVRNEADEMIDAVVATLSELDSAASSLGG